MRRTAWACDISEAHRGEEAIAFIRDGALVQSGRGRMPVFTRDARRLAAVWPGVRLPAEITTEDGPEPKREFVVGASVDALRDAVLGSNRGAVD